MKLSEGTDCMQRDPSIAPPLKPTRLRAQFISVPVLVVVCFVSLGDAHAQARASDDPLRFVYWPLEDARALVGSVTANRVALLGAGIGLYAIAQRDPRLQEAVSDAAPDPHTPLFRAVEEFGNVKAVRPAAMMLFLGSLASGNERFQDAAFTSLEAVVVANLLASVMKSAFGRARPYQGEGPRIDPFSGDTSFPSGHSTTAFALMTPWLVYYPSVWTGGLMVLSAGTALSRVASDAHWVSDVVAGSTLGFVTAYVLARTHLNRSESFQINPVITEDGAGVTVAVRH